MMSSSQGTGGGPDALAVLVERFRREKGYPRREDEDQIAARRDLLTTPSCRPPHRRDCTVSGARASADLMAGALGFV